MKVASIISGIVFVLYAVLLLAQLWAHIVEWSMFFKLTVTAGVIIVVTFGVALLYREYIEEKTMQDEKYLD